MLDNRKNIGKLNYLKPTYSKGFFKKIAITSVMFSTIMVGTAAADSHFSTVYHVYIDGERIGTVANKDDINKAIEKKIDKLSETYKDIELVPANLSIVEEQVFRSKAKSESTVKKIESEIDIVANTTAIVINDQTVAYVKNKEEADAILKQMKLKYVSEADLTELEARKKSDATLPALQEGQSRILDVVINEKVSLADAKISPDKIITTDNAVTLLEKGTLEEKKYKVQEGDVLGSIAIDHGLTTKQLLELNPGFTEESLLQIDDELNVTAFKPYISVSVKKEEMKKETIGYEIEVKEDSSMFKGDKKTTQEGQEGEKVVSYQYSIVNGQTVATTVINETVIKEPVTKIVLKGTKVVPSRGSGQLAWPTNGGYVSSNLGYRWGSMHKGIDIARPSNKTIKAADNGTVVSAGWDGGYGNKIVIDHNNGIRTVYAHLSSISVSVGQTVSQGQAIGVMGSTGNSTGVHLHFEVYVNGSLKNPLSYLK